MSTVMDSDEEASRASVNEAETLASEPHCRCVNNGHQLADVLREHLVEQPLVTVLKSKENVEMNYIMLLIITLFLPP